MGFKIGNGYYLFQKLKRVYRHTIYMKHRPKEEIISDPLDLKEYESYLLKVKQLNPRSVTCYLKWAKFINHNFLNNQDYINAFVKHYGNNSVLRGMLRSYIEFKGLTGKVMMPPAPSGSSTKRIIREIASEHIKKISQYIYKNVGLKEGLVFDLMYQGALRLVEIPTISLSSFNWDGWKNNPSNFCELIVLGKGKKYRKVLINSETVLKIADYYVNKMGIPEDHFKSSKSPLFLKNSKSFDPINEKIIYDIVKSASIAVIGRDIRPHEIRHHRATELFKKGVQLKDIQRYLGHTHQATTEIYLHTSDEESLLNITNKLNG